MKLMTKSGTLLTGNLPRSRAPETRETQTGRKVTNFSVRAGSVRNEDGTYTDDWINCVAWGEMADICERLRPGQPVLVAGDLRTREWTGRDGETRTTTELNVDFVLGCGPVPRPAQKAAPAFEDLIDDEGDLPF